MRVAGRASINGRFDLHSRPEALLPTPPLRRAEGLDITRTEHMTQPQMTTEPTPSTEDFAALLDESFRQSDRIEGSVLTGTVIAIDNDEAVVDVGLKAEGRVPLK